MWVRTLRSEAGHPTEVLDIGGRGDGVSSPLPPRPVRRPPDPSASPPIRYSSTNLLRRPSLKYGGLPSFPSPDVTIFLGGWDGWLEHRHSSPYSERESSFLRPPSTVTPRSRGPVLINPPTYPILLLEGRGRILLHGTDTPRRGGGPRGTIDRGTPDSSGRTGLPEKSRRGVRTGVYSRRGDPPRSISVPKVTISSFPLRVSQSVGGFLSVKHPGRRP